MAKNANEVNDIADLQKWINAGQSVGFSFNDRSYCVAYGAHADGQPYISLTDIGGYLNATYLDLDEFMTYARVQGSYVSQIWPQVTDIKLFVPEVPQG